MSKSRTISSYLHCLSLALLLAWVVAPSPARADPSPGLPDPSPSLDRSTPRRTVDLFLQATAEGNYDEAAYALDLRGLPPESRGDAAAEAARQLRVVLQQSIDLDSSKLSDDPQGNPADGAFTDHIGTIQLPGKGPVSVTLARVPGPDAKRAVWVFSRSTVQSLPELYAAHGRTWLEQQLPTSIVENRWYGVPIWQLIAVLLSLPLSFLMAFVLVRLLLRPLRMREEDPELYDKDLLHASRRPLRLVGTLLFFRIALEALRITAPLRTPLIETIAVLAIVISAWLINSLVNVVSNVLERRAASREDADDLAVRSVQTQARLIARVLHVIVVIVAGALVLMRFELVRNVGVSLLASAGVLGLMFGLAAQRSIGAILAGLQLSLTRPLRIGDVVIIETEYGTVEEIHLTYLVVKIWDERRLVVPMSRFLDQPFQNWTRSGTELMGTAFLYADFTLPAELVREKVEEILTATELYDGRRFTVLVTDLKERTQEIRVLMSARTAPELWDLRCHVREQLMSWLRELEGGKYLPRDRLEASLDRAPAR